MGCSSAETVYGSPLTVTGDFIPSFTDTPTDNSLHLRQLRDQICSLAPVPISHHGATLTSVPCNLLQAKFVFIHCDAHHTPRQQPYEGPFKVLYPSPKTFQVDTEGKRVIITVDRLKPAHLNLEHPVPIAKPRRCGRPPRPPPSSPNSVTQSQTSTDIRPQHTRSGRHVQVPQRYLSVLGEWCSGHYKLPTCYQLD
ncbi:uncharacterized protein LOC134178106 [Corticium candelabrum]|uniref:uncharacterized protein LOC134178106 n=1 Tax=Corticium candelabrum TaxID=121492 RepID=UPI002E2641C2|nr:uncharacterized protein LOC134178106 [Corticium candelabrum]